MYAIWQTEATENIVRRYFILFEVYFAPSEIINAKMGKASLPIIRKIWFCGQKITAK